jgi:acetoin utilization deacetylase AcuC-like enzyme
MLARRGLLKSSLGAALMAEDILAAGKPATALLLDPIYKRHETGPGHPEQPARYDAVTHALEQAGLVGSLAKIDVRAANEDEIALCHGHAYIETVKREIKAGAQELSTGDTTMGPHSLDVAERAAGGLLNAVDLVASHKGGKAFCAVRPPGHHARPNQGMGFCIFNNVAIAARYARKKYGMTSLIADWDVHHGNGTQDIFYEDGSVLFFSTHQSPWYPGTGAASERGEGKGKNCVFNVPLPAGSGRAEILGAFQKILLPAADAFKPDLVFISAGFDSRLNDPLGRFMLSDEDFVDLTRVIQEIAEKHAGGRIVSVLEGGYNLTGLASSAAAHVRALADA